MTPKEIAEQLLESEHDVIPPVLFVGRDDAYRLARAYLETVKESERLREHLKAAAITLRAEGCNGAADGIAEILGVKP